MAKKREKIMPKKAVKTGVSKEVKPKNIPKVIEIETKQLLIKSLATTVIDEFWLLRDKFEAEVERKLNANDVFGILIDKVQNQYLSSGEALPYTTQIYDLEDEVRILRNTSIEADKIHGELLQKYEDLNTQLNLKNNESLLWQNKAQELNEILQNGSPEAQEKINELFQQNTSLISQLQDLKDNNITLNDGEFICKFNDEVIEIAKQLYPFLLKKRIIDFDEKTSSYSEALTNYCIKNLLEFKFNYLLNK